MNDTEQRRADVLTRLCAGTINAQRAAQLLGITDRQVRRLKKRFEQRALASIPHGNKGRQPVHTLSPETRLHIGELAEGIYKDYNVSHLRDILQDRHQIRIGRSTLQRLLQNTRSPQAVPLPKPKSVRQRRLRCATEGMLVQIDGSPHDWLEGRAPKMCLMGAIDDATNTVLYLRFCPNECALGYLHLFRHIAVAYGLPMAYYHDKHTILRSPKKPTIEDELAGIEPMSHVQRVLHDLGIESIAAHSPQAKGRIERLWQTLQDRLVKEMRLAQIASLEQANGFLETFLVSYNARFSFEAMDPTPVWVPWEAAMDLDYFFSLQHPRVVKADHTVSFEGQVLQIRASSRSCSLVGQSITVRINAEGVMFLYDGRRRLEYHVLPKAPARVVASPKATSAPSATAPKPTGKGLTAKQRGLLFAGT